MLRADAQSILAENFGDFCYRAGCLKAEITDNHESFINEDARPFFQFRKGNARIDIAIIIGASHYDVRRIFGSGAKKRANPVRGRSDFLNDLLELSQSSGALRPPSPVDRKSAAADPTSRAGQGRRAATMQSLDRMNRGDCPEWSPLLCPQVPHCARRSLWFGSIRRTEWHYSFITGIRNTSRNFIHSRNLSEFDASIIQNVQPSPTAKVPRLKRQAPDKTQFTSYENAWHAASAFGIWGLEFIWRLEFATWDFPTKRLALAPPTHAASCSQPRRR